MPQGSTMQRKEKEKIVFVWKIKKNKQIFFSWIKVNDEPSHHQMHLVNRKDTRGGCGKQKLLKTCGVASVVSTTKMKKGFTESPIKKGCEL
jgi:hypothetical protein